MSDTNSPFVYYTDLDNTLFQNLKTDAAGSYPMTEDSKGAPQGYARHDQHQMLNLMVGSGYVIPVTARSHEQMERVNGWVTGREYDIALTDLGATLLVRDNNGDGQWHAVERWQDEYLSKVQGNIRRLTKDYEQIENWLRDADLSSSIRIDMIQLGKLHLPLYIVLSVTHDDPERVQELQKLCRVRFAEPVARATGSYVLHETKDSICLWPTFVSKGAAVKRLQKALVEGLDDSRFDRARDFMGIKNPVNVCIGDSITDLEFMQNGHFMMAPAQSPIAMSSFEMARKEMDKEAL
jgi:hypothetical protein